MVASGSSSPASPTWCEARRAAVLDRLPLAVALGREAADEPAADHAPRGRARARGAVRRDGAVPRPEAAGATAPANARRAGRPRRPSGDARRPERRAVGAPSRPSERDQRDAHRATGAQAARALPAPVVLWIYDPTAASLVGSCGESFAGLRLCRRLLIARVLHTGRAGAGRRRDRRGGDRVALVFATTSTLYDRHRRLNRKTYLVPNVGDFAHFSPAADPAFAAPELASLEHPVIGFAGNFMLEKVDVELLGASRPPVPTGRCS